jgi:hypothetical protein
VEELARGKYAGFNDSHLHENLTGVEGLVLSPPSVQRILPETGSVRHRSGDRINSVRGRNGVSRRACFHMWMEAAMPGWKSTIRV